LVKITNSLKGKNLSTNIIALHAYYFILIKHLKNTFLYLTHKILQLMKYFFTIVLCLYSIFAQAQQTINTTLTHGGITREYRLYIPAAYNPANAVPLLFNLHGYTSNNAQQEFYGDFRAIADTANFIICLPNGTFDLSNSRFWNVGFAPSNIDDVGFISTLIDVIASSYNIDAARVYSTGMSNGGFMSYSLACQLSNRITAIASVTGSMTITQQGNCTPGRTVPVMQIHGTADATVPYGGNATFLPIDTLVKNWAARNGCDATPTLTNVPDIVTTDGSTAERFDYNNCNAGGAVVLYKAANGAHTWPGAAFNIGVTNMDFSASHEIWKFFLQFTHPNPAPLVTSVKDNNSVTRNIGMYPNPVNNVLHIENADNNIQQINFFDISGKQLPVSYNSANATADVSMLNKGFYLCQIQFHNGETLVKKLVKE
jgi:polyhydroxybutyrate depolymerase